MMVNHSNAEQDCACFTIYLDLLSLAGVTMSASIPNRGAPEYAH